jgi:hypothetical protein
VQDQETNVAASTQPRQRPADTENKKNNNHRKPNRGRGVDETTGQNAHVMNISQSKLNSSRN